MNMLNFYLPSFQGNSNKYSPQNSSTSTNTDLIFTRNQINEWLKIL